MLWMLLLAFVAAASAAQLASDGPKQQAQLPPTPALPPTLLKLKHPSQLLAHVGAGLKHAAAGLRAPRDRRPGSPPVHPAVARAHTQHARELVVALAAAHPGLLRRPSSSADERLSSPQTGAGSSRRDGSSAAGRHRHRRRAGDDSSAIELASSLEDLLTDLRARLGTGEERCKELNEGGFDPGADSPSASDSDDVSSAPPAFNERLRARYGRYTRSAPSGNDERSAAWEDHPAGSSGQPHESSLDGPHVLRVLSSTCALLEALGEVLATHDSVTQFKEDRTAASLVAGGSAAATELWGQQLSVAEQLLESLGSGHEAVAAVDMGEGL